VSPRAIFAKASAAMVRMVKRLVVIAVSLIAVRLQVIPAASMVVPPGHR
jgi:hypothetical protein